MNPVLEDNSLIVLRAKRLLVKSFGEEVVLSRPNRVLSDVLDDAVEDAILEVLKCNFPFDPLVLLLLGSTERRVTVIFCTYSHKLGNYVVRLLVIELSDDARVFSGRQALRVPRFQLARIEPFFDVRFDVLVEVLGVNVQCKRVGVRKENLCSIAPSRLHEVVKKVVHLNLRQIEDRNSDVARFVELHFCHTHLDPHKALVVDRVLLEVRFCNELQGLLSLVHQPNVDSVHHVLASLPKNRVVRELPKVFFEGVSRELLLLDVSLDVGLHPGRLVERQRLVHLGDFATEFHVLPNVSDVSDVFGLRKEVRCKFFDSSKFDLLRSGRVVLKLVVEVFGKFEVHGNEARGEVTQ